MKSSLIDPRVATAVARRIAGEPTHTDSYLERRLMDDLQRAVPRSEELIAASSGIPAPPPVNWAVIDRARWVEANVVGMARLVEPVAERLGVRMGSLPWPARVAQRTVVSSEIGALLGYVSRRVLGQYDVLMPEEEIATKRRGRKVPDPAVLYFVGVNMVETERRHGFVPEDFALWVALHEVTHRFQFAGVPWLRDRFFGLIHRYMDAVQLDARSFSTRLIYAARRLATSSLPPEERKPVYLLSSEQQRPVLDEIQALMAVVEGHGNFVMDSIGADVIPSFGRMRATFERRREQTGAVQRAINHAIGLELKMRQYELGQRFCEAIWARAGSEAFARLWSAPEELPTLKELREPDLWLHRVAA